MSFIAIDTSDDGVCVLRLARPPVNALNGELLAELGDIVRDLETGETPKALVVWGGETVFAAGADVEEFVPVTAETAGKVTTGFHDNLDALARFPRPTIAAITGYALGGGLELSLACDFRVCGDNARLGFPEIQLGLIPGGGGTQRASRLIGPAKAKELVFSGRHVRAQEALEIGLVDRVVDPDAVFEQARGWAASLADGAVVAMGEGKRAIDDGLGVPISDGLAGERRHFAATFETNDAATGIDSFLEDGPGKADFEGA